MTPWPGIKLLKTAKRYVASALSPSCWYLIFSVTNRCNQRCVMCFNWRAEEESDELTLEEIQKIAPSFNQLFQFTLSGGEPILRPDLPEIIQAFCRPRPVPRITLPSNGQTPARLERLVSRICRQNPNSNINIALSLDGLGDRHDRIRGVKGAFKAHEESRERLDRLKKIHPNLSVVVASVASAFNQDHIPHLLEYIEKRPDPGAHGLMLARGETREAEAAHVDENAFLEHIQHLREIQRPTQSRLSNAWADVYLTNRLRTHRLRRMDDPCLAGSKLLVLDHKGDLAPCELFEPLVRSGDIRYQGQLTFGNVREVDYNVDALLQTDAAKRLRRFIENRGCWCTFECALLNNFALNPKNYPRVLGRLLGLDGRR